MMDYHTLFCIKTTICYSPHYLRLSARWNTCGRFWIYSMPWTVLSTTNIKTPNEGIYFSRVQERSRIWKKQEKNSYTKKHQQKQSSALKLFIAPYRSEMNIQIFHVHIYVRTHEW